MICYDVLTDVLSCNPKLCPKCVIASIKNYISEVIYKSRLISVSVICDFGWNKKMLMS